MGAQENWAKLKIWVGRRHDYLEKTYQQTNFSADAAELGAYRSVFQAMKDLEEQDMQQQQAKAGPQGMRQADPMKGRGPAR